MTARALNAYEERRIRSATAAIRSALSEIKDKEQQLHVGVVPRECERGVRARLGEVLEMFLNNPVKNLEVINQYFEGYDSMQFAFAGALSFDRFEVIANVYGIPEDVVEEFKLAYREYTHFFPLLRGLSEEHSRRSLARAGFEIDTTYTGRLVRFMALLKEQNSKVLAGNATKQLPEPKE